MKYTKAQLEELVFCQLENLTAIQELVRLIKEQNGLLEKANKRLSQEISGHKAVPYPKGRLQGGRQ